MNETGIDRGTLITGFLFIVIGALFLLDRLDVWTVRAVYIFPILLIGLGLAVLFGGRSRT